MRIIFLAIIAAFGVSLRADSVAISLVDPADPIRITNAKLDINDEDSVAIVELENETAFPVDSREVWLNTGVFYTRSEVERAGDHKVMGCGLMGRAELDPSQTIAAHGRAIVRMSIKDQCMHNREHEHYFVTVERIAHKFNEPSWKRDSKEFARLLSAAMPHE